MSEAQPYPILPTKIDRRSDEYRGNHATNTAAVEKLRGALREATVGGGDKYNSRHKAAGKLLPRERIELLLDPDSHFLELCRSPATGSRATRPAPAWSAASAWSRASSA